MAYQKVAQFSSETTGTPVKALINYKTNIYSLKLLSITLPEIQQNNCYTISLPTLIASELPSNLTQSLPSGNALSIRQTTGGTLSVSELSESIGSQDTIVCQECLMVGYTTRDGSTVHMESRPLRVCTTGFNTLRGLSGALTLYNDNDSSFEFVANVVEMRIRLYNVFDRI
nr:MAG TPA: hypothetical protein [Caudoviricetes sp.]